MDYNFRLDLSSLSKELRLLLEILKTEDDSIGLVKKELYIDIDWGNSFNWLLIIAFTP